MVVSCFYPSGTGCRIVHGYGRSDVLTRSGYLHTGFASARNTVAHFKDSIDILHFTERSPCRKKYIVKSSLVWKNTAFPYFPRSPGLPPSVHSVSMRSPWCLYCRPTHRATPWSHLPWNLFTDASLP